MARAENLNIATVHVRLGNARRQQGELASAEAEYRLARVLFESLAPEILFCSGDSSPCSVLNAEIPSAGYLTDREFSPGGRLGRND